MRNDEEEVNHTELELERLQRQYRMVEGDRRSYNDEAQTTLKKQMEQLDQLRKENEFLKGEIRGAERANVDARHVQSEVAELHAKMAGYQAEIQTESEALAELDKELKRKEAELVEKRKATGGKSVKVQQQTRLDDQIVTMENRLDKALKRYNTCLTDNARLRDTIEKLRQERRVFDSLQKKLEKELQDQKRGMAEVVERSHAAYEARDEAQNKIAALSEKHAKEMQQYDVEIKDITRIIEHDRKLKSFMGVKGQARAAEDAALTQRRKAETQQSPDEVLRTYEEAFARIKETTGIQDTARLVDRFIEIEEKNFALYNYVNELNNDIERLQEKVKETEKGITRSHKEGEQSDEQRKRTLQELEARLAVTEVSCSGFEAKQGEVLTQLDALKSGVESTFNKVGCDHDLILGVLGNHQITEANIMQFMAAIEKRTNELLQLRILLEQKDKADWETKDAQLREQLEDDSNFDPTATLGPKPMPGSLLGTGPAQRTVTLTSIVPPSTLDESDESDSELSARPLTPNEMKQKIAFSQTRRMSASSEK